MKTPAKRNKIETRPGVSPRWQKAGIAATVASSLIAVALGGISIVQAYTTRKSLQGQITQAQSDIQLLTATLAPQLINRIGEVITASISLPSKDVGTSIKSAANIVSTLQNTKAKVEAPELQPAKVAVGKLLEAHPNVPEAWGLAASLATYDSQVRHSFSIGNLPQCRSIKPTGTASVQHGSTHVEFSPVVVSNCVIVLDDPANSLYLSWYLAITNFDFKNCVIIYRGGPIRFTKLSHAGVTIDGHHANLIPSVGQRPVGNLVFENCLILLDFSSVPVPFGKKLTNDLLVAENNPITISAFGS